MQKKKASTFKIVLAAVIGHILEFYDFTIYAVFAVKIGELFFPSASPFAQVLSSLAVFAVGFFMRPLGGILFGHIGDKHGRRTALTISVIGMAIITFAIGLMPTYAAIGIAAPILLVVCRLIQGLCVGGEGAGASIFVLEHLHGIRPGLVGGIVNAALTFGILLAIFTGIWLNTTFGSDSIAWRYAFMLGGLLGLAGLYLRLTVDETPVFEEIQEKHEIVELPIKEVFRTNWRNVILTVTVGALTGASGYITMAYYNVFFKTVMMYDANTALYYTAFANIFLIIFLPMMGAVSDKIGYTKTIAISAIIAMMSSVPLFQMLASNNVSEIYTALVLVSLLVAGIYAPLYPFMLALFSPEQRYSGIACSLNIGIAAFGGTCAMVCLWLIDTTGLNYAGAFYWNFVCVMFLAALLVFRREQVFNLIFPWTRKTEELEEKAQEI